MSRQGGKTLLLATAISLLIEALLLPGASVAAVPPDRQISVFDGVASLEGGGIVVAIRDGALDDAARNRTKSVVVSLPLRGDRSVALELLPTRVVGAQTKFVVGQPDGSDAPFSFETERVHSFRGEVQGYPNSSAVLFSSPRGIRGHVDLGIGDERYELSNVDSSGRRLSPGHMSVRPASRNSGQLPDVPYCGTQTTPVVAGCCSEPSASAVFTKRIRTVEIAVETDYDLYENFNDLTATTDYIIEVFARTNAIFLKDIDARFEIVFLRLFDNPASEKPFMNNPDPLNGYVSYWNSNEGAIARDTGLFASGRRDLPYGGVAYLGAVCTSAGYAVAGYLSGLPDPTLPHRGNYDVAVVAHELGHNFDACHTPDYCPFIDRCYPPPVFPQRGTLMSYCSQTVSGGNLVEEPWYHRRVRRVMRNFIELGAGCVSYDCNQNGIADSADIAGGSADVNGNGIPDECEDCNENTVLDPTDIFLGTSTDLNSNGMPDDCEADCNGNLTPDDRDIAIGVSTDLWGNSVPDECDPDCDNDDTPDYDEIQANLTLDIDRNVVLDSCQDCDGDGSNDLAELMGSGNAWVASDVLNYVGEYHTISGVRAKTSSTGQISAPQDLIVAPGNRVLVTSSTNNKVAAFNAMTGAYLGDFVPTGSGGLSYPTGLMMGPDGHLLVCSRNTNSVLKYDGATGSFLGAFVTAGSGGLTMPFGLTFGPNGNLFVSSGGNQIREYHGGSGAFIRTLVTAAGNGGLSGARGMLFKPDGNLLVASYDTDAILQYNGSTGAFLGKWNSGGTASALYLDGPWGLRLGPTGNVFATRDLPTNDDHDGDHDHDEHDIDELHVTSVRISEFDIRNGKYIRAFIVGDDTGLRSPTGFDFMPHVLAIDCNGNLLQDDCDIASGASADVNVNDIPDECEPATLEGDPAGVMKNRSLLVSVPAPVSAAGAITALRVALVDLQNPQPPNLVCCPPQDFSSYEIGATCTDSGGCARWVGKPGTFLESQDNPPFGSFRAARLQCTPLYRNWSEEAEFSIIGAEIVPSSTYHVQNVAELCRGNEAACAAVSAPLVLSTGRYGDIVAEFSPPSHTTQPDVTDVSQVVSKFKNVGGAPPKAIAQLQPNLPELNTDVNVSDIVQCVDAYKQFAYPFSGPCPCPSQALCGALECTNDPTCVGSGLSGLGAEALCIKTCTGGANAGNPCLNHTHCPGALCASVLKCATGGNAGLACSSDADCPDGTCGMGYCRDRCGRCTP